MLSKPLAFEQDKTAIFLRNQEMHLHFSKLDSIKTRKNPYLPEINPYRSLHILKKDYSSPSILRDKQYFIRRDNKLIYEKLDKINRRTNQINNDSEVIDGYLSIKRYTREKNREIKKGLLDKENSKIKERITHTKSVIDNKILNNEFQKLKKISGYLRKVHPEDSVNNIYLNRKESQIIRKYEKEKADFLFRTRQKERGTLTRRKNNFSSSVDNIHFKTYKTTARVNKIPFLIDKKILRKIAYV